MSSGQRPVHFDRRALEKLRRIVPARLRAARAPDPHAAKVGAMPDEVSFKLTNRCDLRCTHCYQWAEHGYHHRLATDTRGGDLPLHIVAHVLEQTRSTRSNIYLWGGEPLLYRDWDGLVDLFRNDPRWVSICTNGTMIMPRLESLEGFGRQLELVVSLDGFQQVHDGLRGAGSFARTTSGLQQLAERRRTAGFAGEVTVNCVITPPMLGHLAEFIDQLQSLAVDTVYLSLPWHLSAAAAGRMDTYVARHFEGLELARVRGLPSWHSYNFQLPASHALALWDELAAIDAQVRPIKVRHNPRLSRDEIEAFLMGSDVPAQGRTRCTSITSRLDVFPDGSVVSCKFYPEFKVGDLHKQSLADIWHGDAFACVRQTVSEAGLMPACAKCNLLYARGA